MLRLSRICLSDILSAIFSRSKYPDPNLYLLKLLTLQGAFDSSQGIEPVPQRVECAKIVFKLKEQCSAINLYKIQ